VPPNEGCGDLILYRPARLRRFDPHGWRLGENSPTHECQADTRLAMNQVIIARESAGTAQSASGFIHPELPASRMAGQTPKIDWLTALEPAKSNGISDRAV
jgi:hypothetical protein